MTVVTAELQESARKVLSGQGISTDAERSWDLVVELGWLLVAVPEELDGLGLGLEGACALYRELGGSLASVPFLPAMLAVDALCHAEQVAREAWLEGLTAGNYICTPLAGPPLSADRDGAGITRLTGLASAVPSADKASHILLSAIEGEIVALVPLGQPGVKITWRQSWDVTRRLFDVEIEGVALDEALVLARGPEAPALCRRLATHRDFALAADSVGAAAALLDRTVDYLTTRRQFGRPLAMFQALKHRCADLLALTSSADALLAANLAQLGEVRDSFEAELLGKKAKSYCSWVYAKVAEEAVQLHGGIGMTSEYPCHLFLKRALLNVHLGGSNDSYDLAIASRTLNGL